jgi:predicted nucleic acid-binding protein
MIVISDTSPLLYLFLIDLIELLPQLYGQIIIPEVIRDEMIDVGAPTDFRNWAMEPPS